MIAIVTIVIIAALLYFLFTRKTADRSPIPLIKEFDDEIADTEGHFEEQFYSDEFGKYRLLERVRQLPRRTYIKAILKGKYWGVIDKDLSNQFTHSNYFDFNVYEVILQNAEYSKEVPFYLDEDLRIPKDKLPKLLPTVLEKDSRVYEVNLHEPVFTAIKFNRKLHQEEGDEVFGTIEAVVAGYVLDYVEEVYFEKEYIASNREMDFTSNISKLEITKTDIPTGNVQHEGNYRRIEYFYSDLKQTYWGGWNYDKTKSASNDKGCLYSIIVFLASVIGIAFLLLLLPQLVVLLPFIIIPLLLNLIPKRFFQGLFRIVGYLFLLGFLVGLINFLKSERAQKYLPKPNSVDNPEERLVRREPIKDSSQNKIFNDTIIRHYRVWEDYEGNRYEGIIWTRQSDFVSARNFKNSLTFNLADEYDEMIYRLKENDKSGLSGVYHLFDSINDIKQLSKLKFAELVVSFVQDIPYTVVVPADCDPYLYNDEFIRDYLSSDEARCDGFEKFGINSPVEFMSSLNGDCDTRTLLLYTILSNYGYDVALLSSEYYGHSIIGVNLPANGISYQFHNQRYVLWETTAPNVRAGVLPKEISNLKYWRISLKSK